MIICAIVYYQPGEFPCEFCGGDILTSSSHELLFSYDGKQMRVCFKCKTKFKGQPELYLCKVENCNLMHKEFSYYCFRHDENSPPEPIFKVEVK